MAKGRFAPFEQLNEPDECHYCSRVAYSVNLAGVADCRSCELAPDTEQFERAAWVTELVRAANEALAHVEGRTVVEHTRNRGQVRDRLRRALGPAVNEGLGRRDAIQGKTYEVNASIDAWLHVPAETDQEALDKVVPFIAHPHAWNLGGVHIHHPAGGGS